MRDGPRRGRKPSQQSAALEQDRRRKAQTTPLSGPTGRHCVRSVATALPAATVRETVGKLLGHRFDSLEHVHVLDTGGRLIGLVPLMRLVAAREESRLDQIMDANPPSARPTLSQVKLLMLARRHRIAAPPVVDPKGRLLGCVPPHAVIEIAGRMHAQDISRLAGILHQEEPAHHALEAPPWQRVFNRLPWLLLGLVGSAVATIMMAGFEQRLSAQIAVAFFIPAIVYLADAVGTQTEALVVRGLSFDAPRLSRLLTGELAAGSMIGAVLGAIAFLLVYFGFGDALLALAVALAIFVAGSLATLCGLFFPWLLWRAGLDPAFGSGPVATVVQDVLSLLIYFWIVQLILPG
jgi:magnesium transporter